MKKYNLEFNSKEEALTLQTQLEEAGYTAVELVGLGANKVDNPDYDENIEGSQPVISGTKYWAVVLTNELVPELNDYITDSIHFKHSFVGREGLDEVVVKV